MYFIYATILLFLGALSSTLGNTSIAAAGAFVGVGLCVIADAIHSSAKINSVDNRSCSGVTEGFGTSTSPSLTKQTKENEL